MPGYKTHMAGGAALGACAIAGATYFSIYKAEPIVMATLLAISVMAALFPDTDTESKGQNIYYGLMVSVDIALIVNHEYKWAAMLGLFAMLPAIGKHRGWTHTWWAMLLVPLPIIVLPWVFFRTPCEVTVPFYAAAVVGYLSHLLLDREW